MYFMCLMMIGTDAAQGNGPRGITLVKRVRDLTIRFPPRLAVLSCCQVSGSLSMFSFGVCFCVYDEQY